MAGGEGTRLRPLTSNQPKPMVPIVGKPCMEHIVELLRGHGFDDVIVTVAFLPQAIRSYFGDGEGLGVNMEYSVEESPAGTAGSVGLASDKLDETFLVISGDALCDFDLTRLVEFHKERGAAVTIGLKSVENPLEFGIVVTDDDGRVERFLEKPSWGQVFSDTINTGVYVLEPEVLQHVPADRPYDFSKELFPLLLEMGRPLYGLVMDGYWQDIGNLDQYRQANFDALDEHVVLGMPGIRLRGNVWLGEGVELDDLDQVEGPALISNYCRIAPDAQVGAYSVLSSSVTLLERARTTRSVVDTSTHIGRGAVVEGSIIGRSCDIRAHARLQEGVALGDEVKVGEESVLMPGVRIYPYKEVESGAQIYENLIWESRVSSRLFERDSVSGLVNVDLTPEVVTKLAVALGTALPRGARIVASREAPAACRMIERAMIAGLNSTGVGVSDLRVLPSAVGRHLLKTHDYAAGFHVGFSAVDAEVVAIRFYEEPGIQLTTELQKEVEKHFNRGELRRAAGDSVGNVDYPVRPREIYAEELLETLDQDAIRERDFRIVVDYGYSAGSLVLPLVLGPLGVEVVAAHAFSPNEDIGAEGEPAQPHRADEEARQRRRRGLRRRLRPCRRAPVPDRRERPRDPGRAGPAPVPEADRLERAPREARVPGHRHRPGRPHPEGKRPRGDPHAGLAQRADEGGRAGRGHLRRRDRRRVRLPGLPARLRRDGEPLQAPRAPGSGRAAALRARGGAARLDPRPSAAAVPLGPEGDRDAGSHRTTEGPRPRPARRDQGQRPSRLGAGAARSGRAARAHLRRGTRRANVERARGRAEAARRGCPAARGRYLKLRLNLASAAALLASGAALLPTKG